MVPSSGTFLTGFMKQPLVKKCCDKPDRKACTKHNPKGQVLTKAYESRKKKQNGWQNPPQSSFGIIGHQVEIIWVIYVQPDEYDKAGQGHDCNQAGQCRQLVLVDYPSAKKDNAHANQ